MPATFTVTTLADSGAGSLRTALSSANGNSGADTITFSVAGVIPVTSSELSVSDAVSIVGPGASVLSLTSSGGNRVFNTGGAAAKTAISISGLTITGGKATNGKERILDIQPTELHQRTPLFIGSKKMMEELEGELAK